MILPVPDILLDTESSKLCTDIQDLEAKLVHLQQQTEIENHACSHLNKSIDTLKIQIPHTAAQLADLSNKLVQQHSALELKHREAAHAKEFIAAQHTQQANLDSLALRFETDCLKAEDRLQESETYEEAINNEYQEWARAENGRKEVVERAMQEGKNQIREMAELHRQLEASSLEAAAAAQASKNQKSNAIAANMQVDAIRKALNAAQEEAAVLRSRLDETELALTERTAALKLEARSAMAADEELLKALKQVVKAREGLDDEVTAGKELSIVAADAERKRVQVENSATAAQSSLQNALQEKKLAEIELKKHNLGLKQSETAAKGALEQAGHSARFLAELLQKHRELEKAIQEQEDAEKNCEQHSTFASHVDSVHRQNKALEKKLAELSKQKIRLEHERELLKENFLKYETAISNTQAQCAALDGKADTLREQLQHHEGALYRVDFKILVAKRAAAVEEANTDTESAGESLRILKQELQNELENARIAQRKQVRTVWEVEEAAKQVGVAADGLQQELNKLSQQQKIEDVALKTAETSLHITKTAREDTQIAVDRASMTLARSQERFAAKSKAALQLSTAVDDSEVAFKTRARELESRLQEVNLDHHTAVNALHASKSALASRNVAVSTAAATLSTLELKSGQGFQTAENEGEGGVAGVCAEMQRQVEELQAALAAAEADCDVLENALIAQKQATAAATTNHHF